MTDDEAMEHALTLEERVWAALRRGDPTADAALLAADFLGVYPTGFATRDDHVRRLADGPTVHDHRIESARLLRVHGGALLLSYEAAYRRSDDEPWERMFVSSLWEHRDGEWRNTFSQDTVADTDHPVP